MSTNHHPYLPSIINHNMKKASLYIASLAAAMLAMTSCDDKTDGGVMQVNPQLPEITESQFSVTKSTVTGAGAVDLGSWADSGYGVPVLIIKYDGEEPLPEGALFSVDMQVSDNADFDNPRTVTLTSDNNATFHADAQSWDNAFRSMYGKAPFANVNYIRFAAYLEIGSQRSRIGSTDNWYLPTTMDVTPIDLGIVVEEAYYLVGTVNGWDLSSAVKFAHSDKNVYDDPVFTLNIDIPTDQAEAGWWWKIVPESAFQAQSWDGLYGVETDGDTSLSGNLYAGGNAGQLKTAGPQLFTIDMLSCTYSVTNAVPALWTPGNSNGWNPAASSQLTTTDYTNYQGFLYLNGEWLMTPAPNWDNKYALGEGGAGTLGFNASTNLPLPEQGAGLYWTQANLGNLTYSTTPVTVIGLIGDFNGWGADVEMTPSEDMLTWTAELTVEEGQGWKFRCNNGWDINLGGTLDDLVPNGANLSCPAAGTYVVTLNLAVHPYSATVTAK